jgi:nitrogen fixation/metabolism regulation signal transduction histidine kinase
VAAGDFSERLAETGSDEIGELVSSFNLMTDRLEDAQREIVRKKRLEAWSEMARQVAHEIKNPLTPIKLSVQYMERAWRDKKPGFDDIFADTVKTLYEQVDILRRIARDFSSFGRSQKLQITSVDLPGLAAEVLAPYAGALAIEITELEVLAVKADREALRKIILNLVENAREAMDAGGRLDVSWRRESGGGELSIRDHGSGIPEDLLDKLFEPYFSTKTSGTGLGLAISAQLCDEMNGRLRLMNHPEGGALSVLWLPEAADD